MINNEPFLKKKSLSQAHVLIYGRKHPNENTTRKIHTLPTTRAGFNLKWSLPMRSTLETVWGNTLTLF